ncbi:MAG: SHOCT domain-containing protein [Gemmatimonas sp.]
MRKPVISGAVRIAIIAAAAVTPAAWAQQTTDADRFFYGPHMMWWNGGWYGMIFGPFFMILSLAAVVAVVVLLVRWLGGSSTGFSSSRPSTRSPLDILKERFARGEIDKDEYEERRRVLGA